MAPAARMSNPADFRAIAISGTLSGEPVTRAVGNEGPPCRGRGGGATARFNQNVEEAEAGSPGRRGKALKIPPGAVRQSTTDHGSPRVCQTMVAWVTIP